LVQVVLFGIGIPKCEFVLFLKTFLGFELFSTSFIGLESIIINNNNNTLIIHKYVNNILNDQKKYLMRAATFFMLY
jgi:hypothetical protein